MEKVASDWMVYVAWRTISDWKQATRRAAAAWESTRTMPQEMGQALDDYPFQYASRQARFMKMAPGHSLWLVSLPQFEGFCQAPSIMARLELEAVYDRMQDCPVAISRHSDGFGRYLAVGKPGRAIDTYPPLYNVYDFLMSAEFLGEETHLHKYKEWLAQGDFDAQGPYYRMAQHFRTLRQLTPASGRRLREIHKMAVDGRRAFISYKTTDVRILNVPAAENHGSWLKRFVASLEEADILSWWDKQQMVGRSRTWDRQAELISALLDDGVQQATWFIALGTEGYGTAGYSDRKWTLEEWVAARSEADNPRRRGKLRRLLIEFGRNGAAARLPGDADATVNVAADASPEALAQAVVDVMKRREPSSR